MLVLIETINIGSEGPGSCLLLDTALLKCVPLEGPSLLLACTGLCNNADSETHSQVHMGGGVGAGFLPLLCDYPVSMWVFLLTRQQITRE